MQHLIHYCGVSILCTTELLETLALTLLIKFLVNQWWLGSHSLGTVMEL